MEFIQKTCLQLSEWVSPYVGELSTALVATILVVYGTNINSAVKRKISGMNFVIRVLVFVLLCAVGYGAVTVYASPILAKFLVSLGSMYLGVAIVGAFILIGVLAERKKQI